MEFWLQSVITHLVTDYKDYNHLVSNTFNNAHYNVNNVNKLTNSLASCVIKLPCAWLIGLIKLGSLQVHVPNNSSCFVDVPVIIKDYIT